MRRTLIGLAAAGLLLVTGCSDSDNESGSDDSASGGGSTEEFCTEFQALDDQFSEDPEAVADADQVLEALEGLDPPDEIADDYETVLEVGRLTADVDVDDEEAMEEAQQLTEDAAGAQERVSTFLEDECDIDTSE